MVRRHYNLPSLNALAAFEAAARHLSLTRASSELNVTPGAVSKQVKMLEDEIGRPLFIRLHRALQLTPEGETVYRTLRETFERISANLQSVHSDNAIRTVSIGATTAFAQLWLKTLSLMVAPHSFYVTWSAERRLPREAEILRDWLLTQTA